MQQDHDNVSLLKTQIEDLLRQAQQAYMQGELNSIGEIQDQLVQLVKSITGQSSYPMSKEDDQRVIEVEGFFVNNFEKGPEPQIVDRLFAIIQGS